MSRNDTYHITLGKRRTTVSLDNIISQFIALKLEKVPETIEAYTAVREYLQIKVDEAKDPGRSYVSQWLREQCLFDLLDKKISSKYWDWFEVNFNSIGKRKKKALSGRRRN